MLGPGHFKEIKVDFLPNSAGPKTAALKFTGNDPDESIVEVALSATGVSLPAPDIAVSSDHWDFGEVLLDSLASHGFVVSNAGATDLHVTATTLFGDHAAEFTVVSGEAPFMLAQGDSQTVMVVFAPISTGAKSAALNLESDDPDESSIEIRLDGIGQAGPTTVDDFTLPILFSLGQNHPNPFNPSTKITFALPSAQSVTLKIFNLAGQEVATLLHNERKGAGNHEVTFAAGDLPSGVYFYQLRAGEFVETRKMLLVR